MVNSALENKLRAIEIDFWRRNEGISRLDKRERENNHRRHRTTNMVGFSKNREKKRKPNNDMVEIRKRLSPS